MSSNDQVQSRGIFIDGDWHQGAGLVLKSKNPANNEIVWEGNIASEQQVDHSIDVAKSALTQWSNTNVDERIKIIRRFADLVAKNIDNIAQIIAKENGKVLWEATAEANSIYAKAEISIKAFMERTPNTEEKTDHVSQHIRYKPHGVIAVFGPFNFPGHLPNGHIIPALLAGNTIIFKPSEHTPKISEFIVNLWQQADLPKGVLNLIQGDRKIAELLSKHPGINGVFFTGSSAVGKSIYKHYANNPGKILALEMGGNNPLIVTQLENIDAAVYNCIQSAFITTGQRCTCARRLFVPKGSWGDQFIESLVAAAAKITIGSWNEDPQPFMGPLISAHTASIIENAQKYFIQMGAGLLLENKKIKEDTGFLSAGIIDITDIHTSMADEENFGPLLKVIRYNSFEEAISWANNTNYGLSAGLLSEDKKLYQQFYRDIKAGIINWNKPTTGASAKGPFGGIGDSGNLRPSAYFAADYCAYPVASMETEILALPKTIAPGISLK